MGYPVDLMEGVIELIPQIVKIAERNNGREGTILEWQMNRAPSHEQRVNTMALHEIIANVGVFVMEINSDNPLGNVAKGWE